MMYSTVNCLHGRPPVCVANTVYILVSGYSAQYLYIVLTIAFSFTSMHMYRVAIAIFHVCSTGAWILFQVVLSVMRET